ncbi:hypothetical protein HDU98_001329 [Podochytrium sp. JEL0797]|nr:hypothetical protein HDU98_001329 [Podochytrium sp. JEL0797]
MLCKATTTLKPAHSYAVFSESLDGPGVSARVASHAPNYRRNSAAKVSALVVRLLVAPSAADKVRLDLVSSHPREDPSDRHDPTHSNRIESTPTHSPHITLTIHAPGLVFIWPLFLTLTHSPPTLPSHPANQSLTCPLVAALAVLLETQKRIESIVTDKEKEIDDLRNAFQNNQANLGAQVRLKKPTRPFNASQTLTDSFTHVFNLDSAATTTPIDAITQSVFETQSFQSLFANVSAKLDPLKSIHDPSDDLDAADLSNLDYAPGDGLATQRVNATGRSTAGPAGMQGGLSASQQSQKAKQDEAEEAVDLVDKGFRELLEEEQKRKQGAPKAAKKRKIL